MAIVAVVFVVILLGATLQRVSGMGVGLIAAPILAIAIGPAEGVLVVNVLAAMNATLTTFSVRKHVNWAKTATIGSVMIVGSAAAAALILAISAGLLQAIVGAMLIVALAVVTWGKNWFPPARGTVAALGAGVASGFTNGLAGVAGPTLTVYAQASRWETREFTATLQPLFVIAGLISAGMKLVMGASSLGNQSAWVWVAGLAAMVLGIGVGGRIAQHLSQPVARKLALTVAAAGAVVALVRGLTML